MTLFRVSTGEGWNLVMDDMIRMPQANYHCTFNIETHADFIKYK